MSASKARKELFAKQIASKKAYEVDFMEAKYGVPKTTTWEIINKVGFSRTRMYEELRKLNYPVPPKRRRNNEND